MRRKPTNRRYYWRGKTHDGSLEYGIIEATHINLCQQQLSKQDILLTHTQFSWRSMQNISLTQTLELFSELDTLMQQKYAFSQALDILAQHPSSPQQGIIINNLSHHIKQGHGMATAFSSLTQSLGDLSVALLSLGEKTDCLAQTIKHITEQLKQQQQQREGSNKKLAYPLFLLMFSGAFLLFLLFFIMPTLQPLFLQFDTKLPLVTRALLQLSILCQHSMIFIIIPFGIGVTYYCIQHYLPSSRRIFLAAHIPYLHQYVINSQTRYLFHTLALLLNTDYSLSDAIELIQQYFPKDALPPAARSFIHEITQGTDFYRACESSQLLPPHFLCILSTTQQAENLPSKVNDVYARLYSTHQKSVSKWLQRLEPACMLLLAGLIGSIMYAIYIPIIQLGLSQ